MATQIFIPENKIINASRLIESSSDFTDEIEDMLAQAAAVASPKAMYAVMPVEAGEDCVTINGITLRSPLVVEKLSTVHRAFPYIVTCGTELEDWSKQYSDDPLAVYWADEIKKLYLGCVGAAFRDMIKQRYDIKSHFASLNPGSLKTWDISGQLELFSILNRADVEDKIGVHLTDSMLMLPSKTGSGIGFESAASYENCQRCPNIDCPNRRAEFIGEDDHT